MLVCKERWFLDGHPCTSWPKYYVTKAMGKTKTRQNTRKNNKMKINGIEKEVI